MGRRVALKIVLATAVGLAALSLGVAPAGAALPRTYQVTTVPNPLVNTNTPAATAGRFGVALVNAGDLNGDGEEDILVGTDEHGGAFAGTVFELSGANGSVIRTLPAPDGGGSGNGAAWGAYIGKIGQNAASPPFSDIGSCPGFTGSPSDTCDAAHGNASNTVGAPDGVPDLLITALGVDVGGLTDAGRAYVIDGATGAVLKRIDMPAADITDQLGKTGPPKPAFGRTILAPAGQPPCGGNEGIGACAAVLYAVKVGDMDGGSGASSCSSGGNCPDIIVDASDFYETGATANPDSDCADGGAGAQCLQAGRAYIFRGETIAGSSTTTIDNTPQTVIKNPAAQADEAGATTNHNRENLGYSIEPVGDLGKCKKTGGGTSGAGVFCATSTGAPDGQTAPDGIPDVVISSHRTDDFGMDDVGVALLFDLQSEEGSLLATYRHPEPQPASIFAFSNYNQPAIGDVGGGSTNPDVYQAAMRQNNPFTGGGRGYLMNGNFLQGGSPNSISFATLNDPTPNASEDFGTSSAGIGNVASAETSTALDDRNEVLVGAYGPHNPGTNQSVINDVHIFSPLTEQELQRLKAPEQQAGLGFGNALAPMGDLNGDGFLDYAIGAGLYDDVTTGGTPVPDAGRIYIFRSDNSPAPPTPPTSPPTGPTGPAGPTGGTGPAGPTLAGRIVDLAASRSRIRRGRRVKLAGEVEAFSNPAACERRVRVLLQRRRPHRVGYRTFARRRTTSRGRFSVRTRPKRTYVYRALVRRSSQCLGAASDRERVTVVRRRR
jgi:hypothetical protein